jgi:hypothetical protein
MAVLQLSDARTDGVTLGQSTTDLVSFHGVTPVAQRSGSAQAAVSTTASTTTTPAGYATTTQANAIVTLVNELRAALVAKGIIAGA